jgi:hypothetical protein
VEVTLIGAVSGQPRNLMESCMQNLYEPPPVKIGKYFWRIVVRDYEMLHGRVTRCTAHEFKRPPIKAGGFMVMDDTWGNCREWPGYDSTTAHTAGCPGRCASYGRRTGCR